MTTQVNTKIRLVRCPKCRKVLAELPGVPLYKCGGCGTVLQAKNRRLETGTTESSSKEIDFVAESREDDLEAISSNIASTSQAEIESLSDKDDIRRRDENSDSVELRDDPNVLSISPEVACPPNEDSSIEAKNFIERDSLCQISKRFYDKYRDDHSESSQGRNFLDEVPSSCEFTLEGTKDMEDGESQRALRKGDGFIAEYHNSPEHEYSNNASSREGKIDDQTSRGNNDESRIRFSDQHEDLSGEIKPSGIVSRENESTEKNMNTSVGDSNVTSRSPSKESLVSFYLTSPDNENPDNFPSDPTRNFRRLGSQDFIGSPSLPATNYPKVRGYYAYDGSESSYGGNDDQIHERISQPSRRNNTATGEPEWGPTSSSHCVTRNNRWSQSTRTSRYAGGNRTRINEQEGISKLLFPSRMGPGPVSTGYQNGPLRSDLVFRPPYMEPDKIDLLRTVCELKDQLNRMHFQYNQFSPGREVYSDVCYPHRRNLRHNQPEVYSGRLHPHYGPRISCSCSHCGSGQNWRYSAHLPQHNSMHRKSGPCGVQIDHTCYNIPNSSSPLLHASSGPLLWGCGIEHEDEIKPARLKERYFAAKRCIRTVAGGAPMVACYHCSELLLLPVDFLLFTKKYHRLMCDACKKVLRFSVRKGTHIVPYFPGASAPPPPPSEADEYNDATRHRNTEPLYHSSSSRCVDPVSCSDDYGNGRSFGMSCSTEGEYYNGKISSSSSYEDRKMKSLLTEPQDEDGSLVRGDESARPPSETAAQETGLTRLHCSNMSKSGEVTSGTEETSSSPLHRLMGYSSLSQVLDKWWKDENQEKC
ncbi:hypothetical protein OROGR_022703 [Orobanche gracilis]